MVGAGGGIDRGYLSERAAPSGQRRSKEYVVFTSAPAGRVEERKESGGKVEVVGHCRSNSKYA